MKNQTLFIFLIFYLFLSFGIDIGRCKKRNGNSSNDVSDALKNNVKSDKSNKNIGVELIVNTDKKTKEESSEKLSISGNNGNDKGDNDNTSLWKNSKTNFSSENENTNIVNNKNQYSMNYENYENDFMKNKKEISQTEDHENYGKNKISSKDLNIELLNNTESEKYNADKKLNGKKEIHNVQTNNIDDTNPKELFQSKKENKDNIIKEEIIEPKEINKSSSEETKEISTLSNNLNNENISIDEINGNDSNEPPIKNNRIQNLNKYSDKDIVSYLKNTLKDSFFKRNGLDYSITSVSLYNEYVDTNEYEQLNLKEGKDKLIILIVGNKFFLMI